MGIESMARLQRLAPAVVLLAAVAAYFAIDRPLTEAVTAWPSSVLETFEWITELGHSTKYIVASALGFLVFRFGWKRRRLAASSALIFGSIVIPGLLVNLIKILVGRYRPHKWLEDGLWGFDPLNVSYSTASFPSGHASTIFGLSMAFALIFPRLRWLWFTIAVVVGFSRIVVGAHYFSDVLCGAYLGLAISVLWARWLRSKHLDPGRAASTA